MAVQHYRRASWISVGGDQASRVASREIGPRMEKQKAAVRQVGKRQANKAKRMKRRGRRVEKHLLDLLP